MKIFPLLVLLALISCKTRHPVRSYVFDRGIKFENVNGTPKPFPKSYLNKSISLINDSILNYTTVLGDVGSLTIIRYKIENQFLIIDSLDVYNKRPSFQAYGDEGIFGDRFHYTNDSLVNIRNGDRYYPHISKTKKHQ